MTTWTYRQTDGALIGVGGDVIAGHGYSGIANGKNNPAMQDVHNLGPIPQGKYTIGYPVYTVTHGPYVLGLTPDAGNQMFGRSGFLIHGDSLEHPGNASQGCIILTRVLREEIFKSGINRLLVIK